MAKQVQIRRGTTAQHLTFTGAIGEITVDTTNYRLYVHDGTTQAGFSVPQLTELTTVSGLIQTTGTSLQNNIDNITGKLLVNISGTAPSTNLLTIPISINVYVSTNILIGIPAGF